MNIKDVYWKWKRIIRKRREAISRAISICLIVAVVALVSYIGVTTYQSDKKREALANQQVDDTSIKSNTKRDYGEAGFNKVAENDSLILSADYTTGEICVTEKASGMKWYSNPQDRESDEYVTLKNRLSAQFYVKFVNLDEGITQEMDNFGASVRKGGMEHELIENGIKFTFGFPIANVYIPVQYTLCEDGLQAEIVTGEIKGVGSNPFLVESIALLPFFGAGGLEDEGYLFVPDGSGALIEYNNNKQSRQNYNAMVYGSNPTLTKQEQETVRETISLPVFGAKTNDNAFFAIITNGDASSSITATTSKKDSAYNHVYSSAILREYELLKNEGSHVARKESHSIAYSEDLMEENYTVKYFFLEGNEANYTGMSNFYKDYLMKEDLMKVSELADKKYMVLDLVGAVSIEKYVVGIKRPVVTPLTTYDEVCQIVKDLKDAGVENLIVNYIGAMNSGLNNKLYDEVDPESVLGSKKDFKNMISYLEEEDVILFMESNPIDLYNNGNGYRENKDSTKTFFDKYAFQYRYELDLGSSIKDTRWHLLKPTLLNGLVSDFTGSLAEWNLGNVSFARLGEVLYSDYIENDDYTARPKALDIWTKALSDADQLTKYLMVHGGNAYCSPYADVITDISSTHSSFEMEDQSIPFYQMTFQDSTLLTAEGINTTVDYEYAFLKALETGCSLKYNWIYGDVSQLVGTEYNTMVSYSYDYWKDIAVAEYLEMQKAVGQLAGEEITWHEFLTEDVSLTRYGTTEVVINYGTESYTYNGVEVSARNYQIISGGAA